ncbi:MAG: hypothetical protein KDK45_11665, partial [Leptospiraceae bacterium]|nr:hypothetical protein [Leptospiraceae bacterium]
MKLKIFIIFIYSTLLLFFTFKLDPENMFVSDTFIKLIQANSIIENNFLSEVIHCKNLSVFNHCQFLTPGSFFISDKLLGPFPIFQTFLMAAIIKLSFPEMIQWVSTFLFIISLTYLYIKWNLHPIFVSFMILCTPAFIHSISFFGYAISFFFLAFGLSFLFTQEKNFMKNVYAFLLGLPIFFRPEFILISGPILFFYTLYKSNKLKLVSTSIFFLLPVFSFLTINYLLYNNILGTRIISNKSGIFNTTSLIERWNIIQSLLFYGNMRVGLFMYTPIFLL